MKKFGKLLTLLLAGVVLEGGAQAQKSPAVSGPDITVRPEEHISKFLEDPFVTEYRRKFFSVFQGKTDEYEGAMKELDAMLAKNPNDARAMVWHGNGLMVRAAMLRIASKSDEAKKLLVTSKQELDKAVSLDPNNINILAMRAVTLYIAGTYWKDAELPEGSWQAVIQDLEKTRKLIKPNRMGELSVHARGEILSELATAYQHTNQPEKAKAMWQEVEKSVPNSRYAEKAAAALKPEQKRE